LSIGFFVFFISCHRFGLSICSTIDHVYRTTFTTKESIIAALKSPISHIATLNALFVFGSKPIIINYDR
jgi:hypothetical protein